MIKISKYLRKLIILSLFFLIGSLLANPATAAFTWNQTSQGDFEAGELTDVDSSSAPGQIKLSLQSDEAENMWTSTGEEISTGLGDQRNPQIIADGFGGAITAWEDSRNSNYDIYAQKINLSGDVQWTAGGKTIASLSGSQMKLKLVSDGSGGAIIAWEDDRNGNTDIYAQKISASGTIQWTTNGIAVTTATGAQTNLNAISDGSGGAIITWEDDRGSNTDIYAQRINSSGSSQWASNGVLITGASGNQENPQLATDGSNGAIITWQDYRSGSSYDIYAQKVNSSGTVQWTTNGVDISTATNNQTIPKIITDGSAGAIITWQDYRSGSSDDIYSQKINSSGEIQWTNNGELISTKSGNQIRPVLVSDGSGGAIIAWIRDSAPFIEVYAQKIDSIGSVQWTTTGVYISGAMRLDGGYINIISDGANGAILAWQYDYFPDHQVYTQKINSSGSKLWTWNNTTTAFNVADCVAWYPTPVITSDGNEGAIVVWKDNNGTDNIYAQKFGTKLVYKNTGTFISSVYDAGSLTKFSSIAWNENLPTDTDITFQIRTADELIPVWSDDFNDGNVDNVINGDIAFPDWHDLSFEWPPTEIAGTLTFVNPEPVTINNTDDYYFQIDTGYPADYFPGGSTVTANITIITESTTAELYMFVDGWDRDSGYTNTKNSEVEISYTSASDEPFNTVGFDLYLLDHQITDDDRFLINSLTIEPLAGSGNFTAWSAEMSNPSGNEITSSPSQFIQYKANFSTTNTRVTPTLNDVTVYMGLSGNVDISANVDPSLTLNLSSTTCNLLTMTETDLKTCNYNITVNTNADIGYTASIRQDGDFQNGTNVIAPVSGGVGTVTAGTEGYGYATSDTTYSSSGYYIPASPDAGDCDSYNNQHATSAPVKALANTDEPIAQADGPVAAEITTICHAVAISGSTPAGAYSQNITITVVGNF